MLYNQLLEPISTDVTVGHNEFDAFAIRYIYTFVLIGLGRALTLLLANQFIALISHVDSRTCTEKPYWYCLKKITTFCWLG